MNRELYAREKDVMAFEDASLDVPTLRNLVLSEIGRGKRVLDLGCLGGLFSKRIQSQNNEVFGIELNANAAKSAESRGIQVKQFDLNNGIPFSDATFDVVHGSGIFEYIFDTKFLFDECHRVLKPDGFFIFSMANLNSLSNRVQVLSGKYPHGAGAYPEDHFGDQIRIFNVEKVRELCAIAGFRIVSLQGFAGKKARTESALSRFADVLTERAYRLLPSLGENLLIKARPIAIAEA